MQIRADDTTLSDLLSTHSQYVVPRYQREYSWEHEEVSEFWKDLAHQVRLGDHGTFLHAEYFVGAIVLSGSDDSQKREIVDGQQRILTTTILLCALRDVYSGEGLTGRAKAIDQTYVFGNDPDTGDPYFRVSTESPRPYFQTGIQHADSAQKAKAAPGSPEEKRLQAAYDYFRAQLDPESLSAQIGSDSTSAGSVQADAQSCLDAVRNQVLKHTKVIRIDVDSEEDAYTIFETLNARGMSLSSADLVKNLLLKTCQQRHPDDTARRLWQDSVSPKDGTSPLFDSPPDTFLRHYWLSKFGMTSEDRLYKHFVQFLRDGSGPKELTSGSSEDRARAFLQDLKAASERYRTLCNPTRSSWPEQELRPAFDCVNAMSIFGVSAVRPLLMALMEARDRRLIKQKDLLNTFRAIEFFCFKFYAICSLRPSGLDGSYSKTARDLHSSKNKAPNFLDPGSFPAKAERQGTHRRSIQEEIHRNRVRQKTRSQEEACPVHLRKIRTTSSEDL